MKIKPLEPIINRLQRADDMWWEYCECFSWAIKCKKRKENRARMIEDITGGVEETDTDL